jgi:hypothetical protein
MARQLEKSNYDEVY